MKRYCTLELVTIDPIFFIIPSRFSEDTIYLIILPRFSQDLTFLLLNTSQTFKFQTPFKNPFRTYQES